ncbi:selenoprotein P-like [Neocloeon triangulifer]|uniref:selenoprotein P-like n=1 Tax=Neocloeon triangulifer TaxID=2078957 RepID=UPI00286F58BE|nr:selenoprotein P-like [Neocloeon triangulifer]
MCQRQAVKLQNLQLRLEESEELRAKTSFVIVNENHRRAREEFDHLRNLAGQKIITIQGNGQEWKSVKGRKDDILIIDKCGRISFHLSLPWSKLQLAYVKAAIVATIKDQPCGSCSQTIDLSENSLDRTVSATQDVLPIIQTLTNTTEENSNNANGIEEEQKKQRQLNWMRPYLNYEL